MVCLQTTSNNRRNYVVKFSCLPYFRGHSIETYSFSVFVVFSSLFFNTASSSTSINCDSVMSCWPLITFWIVFSVILEWFPCRFLKCSFHFWILSSWLAALLLLPKCSPSRLLHLLSIVVFASVYLQPNWPWMYPNCSFWYVLVSSLGDFKSFCALPFVCFLLSESYTISTSQPGAFWSPLGLRTFCLSPLTAHSLLCWLLTACLLVFENLHRFTFFGRLHTLPTTFTWHLCCLLFTLRQSCTACQRSLCNINPKVNNLRKRKKNIFPTQIFVV